jgi:hypothetical protein
MKLSQHRTGLFERFCTRTSSFAIDARRLILFITTMKPNVPFTNARFYSRRLTGFPEISLRSKLLFICAASAFAFGLNWPAQALEPGKIWVASWTASPQGPYPAGWAVAQPDLSFALPRGDTDGATDQTFRLIVKPDLWSKTIRLRLASTFGSRPVTLGPSPLDSNQSGATFSPARRNRCCSAANRKWSSR